MLEEIADSMTTGGILAAAIGLCAALAILILRVRERSGEGRREPATPAADVAEPAPDLPDEPPLPASMPTDDEAAPPNGGAAAAKAADDRPASAFKPYVPPKKK